MQFNIIFLIFIYKVFLWQVEFFYCISFARIEFHNYYANFQINVMLCLLKIVIIFFLF
jgi:hypothetical protein